jgi:hypothetical protein
LSLSLLFALISCVLCGAFLYGLDVATAAGSGAGTSARTARDTAYRFYVGNLHSHTSYSDGTGTPEWAYCYARDTARIDFLAVTDHHQMLSELEYEDVLYQADVFSEDGVFVAIPGQEWSGGDTAGPADHATVLGADHVFTAPEDDVPAFYQELLESGAVGVLAHPAMGSFDSLAYSAVGDSGVCAVEVRSVFYEPQYTTLLNNGWRLGADGSQDNHQANWGDGPRWTVALACSLTRDHIIDAVRSHRTYSTTDRHIQLKFRAQGCWMGGELEHEGNIVFSVDVADTNELGGFSRIELFQNGQVVSQVVPNGNPFSWRPEITPPPGENYYFVKVFQEDIDRAWSAPIWTRCTTDLPSTPVLHTPADGDTVDPYGPFLAWRPSSAATSYVVQVSEDPDFPDDGTTETFTGIVDTCHVLPDDLDRCREYYHWRVRAANGFGQSAWSGVRRFTVGGKPLFCQSNEVRLTTDPAYDAFPSIARSGGAMWVAWSSPRAGDSDVYYRTKFDDLAGWSEGVRLTMDPGEDTDPAVGSDWDGNTWVCWESDRDGDLEVYSKSYDGESWSAEENLTAHPAADVDPAVAEYADSLLWVVWSSDRADGNFEIYCRSFNGTAWTTETRLTSDPGIDRAPSVVAGDRKELWVVWASDRDGDYELYRRVYGGVFWGPVEQLTSTPEDESDPAMARTAGGIVWLVYARNGDLFYRTHQVSCWSNETALPTGVSFGLPPCERPAVLEAADARVWMAYDSSRNSNTDIYTMRSNDSYVVTGLPEVSESDEIPAVLSLAQSHPNPFSPDTRIRYELFAPAVVDLRVYDVAGRLVRTLASQSPQGAGEHDVVWDGRSDGGQRVGRGVYFCRLSAGVESATMKMVLLE